MRRIAGLWHHSDFMKLWAGQTISVLGSHTGSTALYFAAILSFGAAPFQLGLLSAARMAPALLLGLLAGIWADRLQRREILIVVDLARGLVLLTIPLTYLLGVLSFTYLCIVAAVVSALAVCFDIAYEAFLPTLVARSQLVEGNSKLSASDSLAEVVGPPVGGWLVQAISAPLAIALDALSFFVSAISVALIRRREATVVAPARERQAWSAAREGLQVIWRTPLLRFLLAIEVVRSLGGWMIGALYGLFLMSDLGMSPSLVGLTVGVGGVSALVGAFISGAVLARLGVGRALLAALLVSSAAALLLPLASGPLVLSLAMVLIAQSADAAHAVYAIATRSLRQAVTAGHLLGRVNAGFTVLTSAAGLAGALLGGVLGTVIGVRGGLAIGVLIVAASCLPGLRSELREVRAISDTAEGEMAAVRLVSAEPRGQVTE